MNPMDVLAPNYMGDELQNSGVERMLENRGVSSETRNYGLGVAEVDSKKPGAQGPGAGGPRMDKLRTHKAREFGMTKETVGF